MTKHPTTCPICHGTKGRYVRRPLASSEWVYQPCQVYLDELKDATLDGKGEDDE